MAQERPPDLMNYEALAQDALKGVIKASLARAATEGIPGDHHFYITFRSGAPGVKGPISVLANYPDEMTIVLQHQFWDLKVDREARQVSVGLSFGGTPSTLVIPFSALTGFLDPHVRVGLRFNPPEGVGEMPEEPSLLPPAEARPAEPEAPPPPSGPAEVVSLDAFRRRPSGRD